MTDDIPIAYVADGPRKTTPSAEELRARVPGWGADLDPADRPSLPKLRRDLPPTGAHWDFPERQTGGDGRERSIEHAFLTPVFGTVAPLHGLSGMVRRYAYRYSEGRAAHWLLLVLGDRIDAAGAHAKSLLSGRPDNPITETGILAEKGNRPLASRLGGSRSDVHHSWIDPILVAGPWIAGGVVFYRLVRRILR
jgi:hypothetical protein